MIITNKLIKIYFVFVIILLILICCRSAHDSKNITLNNKSAIKKDYPRKRFILNNNVIFIYDNTNQRKEQITQSTDKVISFKLSPDNKIIAYEKELKKVKQHGEWEEGETIPLASICSIVIYDIEKHRKIREINPDYDIYINFHEWLSNNYCSFICADDFAVNGIFVYDLVKDTIIDLNYDFNKLDEFREKN